MLYLYLCSYTLLYHIYTYTLRTSWIRNGCWCRWFFISSCCFVFFWHYLKCFKQTTRLVASEGYHVVVITSNFVNSIARQRSEDIGTYTGDDSVTGWGNFGEGKSIVTLTVFSIQQDFTWPGNYGPYFALT